MCRKEFERCRNLMIYVGWVCCCIVFTNCSPVHPVYLPSTPQNIYNNKTIICGGWGSGYDSKEFGDNHFDLCFQKNMDLITLSGGLLFTTFLMDL